MADNVIFDFNSCMCEKLLRLTKVNLYIVKQLQKLPQRGFLKAYTRKNVTVFSGKFLIEMLVHSWKKNVNM